MAYVTFEAFDLFCGGIEKFIWKIWNVDMYVTFEAFSGENWHFFCNVENVEKYLTFEAFGLFCGKNTNIIS